MVFVICRNILVVFIIVTRRCLGLRNINSYKISSRIDHNTNVFPLYATVSAVSGSTLNGVEKPANNSKLDNSTLLSHNTPIDGSSNGDFAQSFVAQKNYILLEKFLNHLNRNLTETANSYVNFCDESFNIFLNERIQVAELESEKNSLGKIRYEINVARKKKLIEADRILREILSAGGLKQMEAKLKFHLNKAEIDMAFMVILQLNIEDAINAKAETAVQIMTHLGTLINEHQDKMVSPPVRLLRLLVRTDDTNIRKQMLRQKLLIGDNLKSNAERTDSETQQQPQATTSPQCEHIVVQAVQTWGGADVDVKEFEDTISDVLSQMSGIGGEKQTLLDLEAKCDTLRFELSAVLSELDAPKISDR